MKEDTWIKISRRWHYVRKSTDVTLCGRSNKIYGFENGYSSQKNITIPHFRKCAICLKYLGQIKRGTRLG